MTASSLGFFLRGVAIPSDLGSLLITVAVMLELWHTGMGFASSLDSIKEGFVDEAVSYHMSSGPHHLDEGCLSVSAAQLANHGVLGTYNGYLSQFYRQAPGRLP